MAEKKSAKKSTAKKFSGFSAEEKAAMKEYAAELKAEAKRGADRASGERVLLAAIAKMQEPDRTMGKKIHAIVTANAPDLLPKTWYGMPAYAKDGKVLIYFREARKFKERYSMIGFQDNANLDKGNVWPIAYALQKLTAADEATIAGLVKKAVR